MPARNPRKYGWVPGLPDHRDYKLVHRPERMAHRAPSASLIDHMPPVYDQGQVGSCTGNASAAAYEYRCITEGLPYWTPSRLFAYYNARKIEGTTASDAGAQIKDVVAGMVKWGNVQETEWPYDENAWATDPGEKCYADALGHRVTAYLSVNQTVDDICTTLANGEPIIFGFSVYSAFEGQDVAKSGVLNVPSRDESLLGGHAVLAVGYDDATRRVTVRNSWGPDWGQKGYFTMPYEYITNPDLADDFWILRTVV